MRNEDDTQKYIEALKAKVGETITCPVCHKQNFNVLDGFFCHYVQNEIGKYNIIGGASISSMVLICQFCGYILEFALDGLSRKSEE